MPGLAGDGSEFIKHVDREDTFEPCFLRFGRKKRRGIHPPKEGTIMLTFRRRETPIRRSIPD